MTDKCLKGIGELDYDFKYDILFFKVKNRDYLKSIEANNIVFDIDTDKFLIGVQIFEASKYLRMSKMMLRKIPNWRFEAKIEGNRFEVRLVFQIELRNKIIEKNPIITQSIEENSLPNSMLVCN